MLRRGDFEAFDTPRRHQFDRREIERAEPHRAFAARDDHRILRSGGRSDEAPYPRAGHARTEAERRRNGVRHVVESPAVGLAPPGVGEVLSVDLAAGATLGMDVATTDLYMKVAGNSAADITGTTKYYTLFATSKAKVDSRTLEAMDVRVEAASGAEAYVCATERLQMTSDTGAAIFYRGEPSIVRSSAKMMGTINSIGQ